MIVAVQTLGVLMMAVGLTVSLATHANLQTVMPLRRPQSLSQQRKDQR
jgi:hypothetical protein